MLPTLNLSIVFRISVSPYLHFLTVRRNAWSLD
ncbi:Protein of unknown function [Pyronema omphalodes CBS 100304]|uniref:Uncharacterized protein n=1 Tax=Pyronema omphalodes (strain CBS 100304) TaxID=1076935 RepID=U4L2C0_PYROM|nr:Protein of unknown function [Pyronema omphalodes CBS 100304]